MYSKNHNKSVHKYVKAHYDGILIRVPKGERERWKSAAAAAGYESLNKFIVASVVEKIESSGKDL